MRQFKDYIWKHVRRSIAFPGIILCLFSFFLYSGIIFLLKKDQLLSNLKLAAYTVEKSLEASDWPLALGYLENLEKSGFLFNIELNADKYNQYHFSGPFGRQSLGLLNLCKNTLVDEELNLGGCIKVFGVSEIFTLAFLIFITLAIYFFVFKLFSSKVLFFIKKISDNLKRISNLGTYKGEIIFKEEDEIAEIALIRDHIMLLLEKVETTSEIAALNQIAAQVAHDIKSPLAALGIVVASCKTLSENERILVRKAFFRIKDIASNLLVQYPHTSVEKEISYQVRPEMVIDLLLTIWAEKRLQHGHKNIDWRWEINSGSKEIFVNLIASDFKRIISNLIDNSIEAIKEKGFIAMYLNYFNNGTVEISLTDNGFGIPAGLLPKVLKGGVSYGKKDGKGLGLSYAIKKIHSWGGSLLVSSKEQEGTAITIQLKTENPPRWFADQLLINLHSQAVILDDDDFIHTVWQERMQSVKLSEQNIKLISFRKANDLIQWQEYNEHADLYLLDYELIDQETTGLDLINKLKIYKRAYLVTSHYDNSAIRCRCEQLGIKIIPKSFAPHIPILFK